MVVDYEWFERTLNAGKEQTLERTRQEMKAKLDRDDIHSYMSWWASFNEKQPLEIPAYRPEYMIDATRKKAAKAKKKKRKMAKASRKKNR